MNEREFIVEMERLSLSHPRAGGSQTDPKAWRVLWRILWDDLKHLDLTTLRTGITRYRKNAENKFFPTSGQLLEACKNPFETALPYRKHETLNGRIIDREYQPWGGACQCARCKAKTASPEFYHAPLAMREQAGAERRELQELSAYKLECLPEMLKGETVVDYRQRVAAQMLNMWKVETQPSAGPLPYQESTPEMIKLMRERVDIPKW